MDIINESLEYYYLAIIDGEKCKDLHAFLIEIGKAFEFPDYYGTNMNALWECINDLSWINQKNFILKIENSYAFLSKENKEVREDIIMDFKKVSEEWQHVPNYKGEDEFREKADFKVYYT